MAVNCYLAWDEFREAALFDTGWEAGPVVELISRTAPALHLHHALPRDHVAALGDIREKFPKARLHSGLKGGPVDQRNRPNDFIHLGSLRITHRDTPGHADDGTTYIIGTWPDDAPHVAIVGDAIFAGSIGRGNQSWDLARQSARADSHPAARNAALPRPRAADHGGGGEGAQSVLLIWVDPPGAGC